MRHVLASDMVAHRWAHADGSDFARTSTDRMHFAGARLYSYATPIASWYDVADGRAFLVSCEVYSQITASRHLPKVRGAVYGRYVFHVPFVTVHASGRAPRVPDVDAMHAGNLAYFVATMRDALDKARRAVVHAQGHVDAAVRAARDVYRYCEAFDLPTVRIAGACRDAAEHDLVAALHDRGADAPPADVVARLAVQRDRRPYRARRYESARAQHTAVLTPDDWRVGRGVTYPGGSTMLRLSRDGRHVETSRGAEVPTDAARMLYRAWRSGRDVVGLRVGAFTVDHADDTGLVIGCHTLPAAECDAFASAQGWTVGRETMPRTAHDALPGDSLPILSA